MLNCELRTAKLIVLKLISAIGIIYFSTFEQKFEENRDSKTSWLDVELEISRPVRTSKNETTHLGNVNASI